MSEQKSQLQVQRDNVRGLLTKMQGEFALALPRLLTPERFVRVALTCINRNPKLLNCTQESLLECLLTCAAMGIEPDGRKAHLIPYKDKCTLIIDYKGIADLVRRSGEVSDLHADIICENDDFDYLFGSGSFLKHKIDIRKDRGEIIGAYSFVKLKDGSESFDVMGLIEIEKVRDSSSGYQYAKANNRKDNPWMTFFSEMAKKTIFRRHSKWLPFSTELRDKLEKDDEPLTEQERFRAAKPAQITSIDFGTAEPPDKTDTDEVKKDAKPKRKNKEKPEPPPRVGGVEQLRLMLKNVEIEEASFMAHLYAIDYCDQEDTLEDLTDKVVAESIERFEEFVAKIRE